MDPRSRLVRQGPEHQTETSNPINGDLGVASLRYGLFVLVALLATVGGFGVGTPELAIWLLLVVGWVTLWMRKRRR